jgi:ankyrin repeat protein
MPLNPQQNTTDKKFSTSAGSSNLDSVVHTVASGVGVVSHSLHLLGAHGPGAAFIQQAERVAEVAASVLHDGTGSAESIASGLAAGAAKVAVGTAVAYGLTRAAPVIGVATALFPSMAARVATSVVSGDFVQRTMEPTLNFVGGLASSAVHGAFSAARAAERVASVYSTLAKHSQMNQAYANSVFDSARDRALNPFASTYSSRDGLPFFMNSASSYSASSWRSDQPYPSSKSSFDVSHCSSSDLSSSFANSVESVVKETMKREMDAPNPSFMAAYLNAQMRLGLGYMLSLSEFRSVAQSTNLIASYNNFNPQAKLKEVNAFCREIGGVANEVAVISDLIDSEAHAKATEYIFCFPSKDVIFPQDMLMQIAREIKTAVFKDKTMPFFSLHFNNDGFLYPVLHHALQNTLTAQVIGLIDYWMKGFLNGGIFDEAFLKQWHEQANCDEAYLRTMLIDLKKYCKENCNEVRYQSLREMSSRYGLQESRIAESPYQQPFMTSFRIIAYQEKIEREGNILIPHPTFRVEYSVDLMPDYENYLENYKREHGRYPEEYQQIRRCYEAYAEEIKESLPQMPFCRDFFHLLGLMNSMCYFYTTLEKMGKEPALEAVTHAKTYAFPKALPPIPVRYFKTLPMEIFIKDVLEQLVARFGLESINEQLYAVFSARRVRSLPNGLIQQIREAVTAIVSDKVKRLSPSGAVIEINEEEIDNIVASAVGNLFQAMHLHYLGLNAGMKETIKYYLEPADASLWSGLALPVKLYRTQEKLTQKRDQIIARWNESPARAKSEIFSCLPQNITIPDPEDREVKFHVHRRNLIGKQISELLSVNKLEVMQAIGQLEEHKSRELAKVPANLRAMNKASIDVFVSGIDGEIKRLKDILANIDESIKQHATGDMFSEGNHGDTSAAVETVLSKVREQAIEHIDLQLLLLLSSTTEESILTFSQAMQEAQDALDHAKETQQTAEIVQSFRDKIVTLRESYLQERAIAVITRVYGVQLERLDMYLMMLREATGKLFRLPFIAEHRISEKYTHIQMGFTGNELAQITGDQFKIIGGCGMSLPNLECSPMENGQALSEALASILPQESETPVRFEFDGCSYTAFRLPVTDIKLNHSAESKRTLQEEALLALQTLGESEEVTEALEPSVLNMTMDHSGAKFIHYAATTLPAPSFKALVLANRDVLNLTDSLGQLPIHAAAQSDNVDVIDYLVRENPQQLNAITSSGATPLMHAIQHGNLKSLEILLRLGANPNYRLPNGLFPLYLCIQGNYPALALHLLRHAASLNVNEKLDSGMTALHLAIELQLEDVALLLIEKGAVLDIKRKSDGFTPYHLAAKLGNLMIIKAMLARGFTPDSTLESKKTALHLAAEAGKLELVRHLLLIGLLPDSKTIDGHVPLTLAIKEGHSAVAEELAMVTALNTIVEGQSISEIALIAHMPTVSDALIARGESPIIKDKDGYDYVYHLVSQGDYHRFRFLLSRIKIDLKQCYSGESLVAVAARNGHFLIVYELLDCAASYKSKSGFDLVHYAIIADELDFVEEWFAENAPREISSYLMLAVQHGSSQCVKRLLDKIRKEKLDKPALIKASIGSANLAVFGLILDQCSDVNQVLDAESNTALHCSAFQGSLDMVELLATRGCNFSARNQNEETAFHIAIQQDDTDMLKRLFKLTGPSDWPADLWQLSKQKPNSTISALLEKYGKGVVKTAAPEVVLNTKKPLHMVNTDVFEAVSTFIEDNAFEEAVEYLEHNPKRLAVFKSPQGGKLLGDIFRHVKDNSAIRAALQSRDGDCLDDPFYFSSPDRLLEYLHRQGVNPSDFKGKENVLLSIITAQTEDEACYRLEQFSKYFSEHLPQLALDHYLPEVRVVELALKLKREKLFELLDDVCIKDSKKQGVVFCGLHEAAISSNNQLVKRLLKRYPVDSLNHKKQTPLMLAAGKGDKCMVALLLDAGAIPDKVDIYGQSALHYALDNKSEDVALFLLPKIKNKNRPSRDGLRPLSLAAQIGKLSVVRYLCEAANRTQDVDELGRNALHAAAAAGKVEIIKYLVQHEFTVDQVEETPRESKTRVSTKCTPLHLAALGGHVEAVKTLVTLGANLAQKDGQGNTVMAYAIMSQNSEMLFTVQQLLSSHGTADDKVLMLHTAAKVNHVGVLSELILSNMSLNAVDEAGYSSLHLAALNNAGDFASLLVQGKDIGLEFMNMKGDTALHTAATFGHVRIIEILVTEGAAVNPLNHKKETPLFLASSKGHLGAVVALLKQQADFTFANKDGVTPAQSAMLNGHLEIAHRLVLAGDKSLAPAQLAMLPGIQPPKIARALVHHGIYRDVEKESTPRHQVSAPSMGTI